MSVSTPFIFLKSVTRLHLLLPSQLLDFSLICSSFCFLNCPCYSLQNPLQTLYRHLSLRSLWWDPFLQQSPEWQRLPLFLGRTNQEWNHWTGHRRGEPKRCLACWYFCPLHSYVSEASLFFPLPFRCHNIPKSWHIPVLNAKQRPNFHNTERTHFQPKDKGIELQSSSG